MQKREFSGAALSFQATLQQPGSRDHHDGPQIRGQETTADFTAAPGPDAVTDCGTRSPQPKHTCQRRSPSLAFKSPWSASHLDARRLGCMVSRCTLWDRGQVLKRLGRWWHHRYLAGAGRVGEGEETVVVCYSWMWNWVESAARWELVLAFITGRGGWSGEQRDSWTTLTAQKEWMNEKCTGIRSKIC